MGRWLNSLTGIDFFILFLLFGVGTYLSHYTMIGFRKLVEKTQKDNPYANEFRTSPFLLFGIAIPYTIIIYRIIGIALTGWLKTFFIF